MKYHIPLYRTESKTETVFADSPHEALKMALATNEGFEADMVTQLGEDDESVADFTHEHTCESCGKAILTGDRFFRAMDEDDGSVCTCINCGPLVAGQEPEEA